MVIKVERGAFAAHVIIRWKGGALSEIDLDLPRFRPATIRTDEDTIALLRRLAAHYPDAVIAGILNKQARPTANGVVSIAIASAICAVIGKSRAAKNNRNQSRSS